MYYSYILPFSGKENQQKSAPDESAADIGKIEDYVIISKLSIPKQLCACSQHK